MKKSFFKKLSFVLALAMIVSIVAPAAGAFAAADPTINVAKKYLFLGEKNEYDFHIDNKVKGSTYKWVSSNESVAVVDEKSGYTTAVAVGTATITCTIKTKKDTWTSETAVVVKDNIKTLTITNDPADKKLAVGATNDYNRSFTTQGGSTTKTTSITRWTVTDKDGKATTDATIDTKGVFTATKAGDYKITAMAFQSSAKYEAYKTSGTGVLATAETTVSVKPSIKATAQVDKTHFTVTFDADMSKTDILTKSAVYQVINGKNISTGTEKIKAISLDSTGKVATVEMYADFSQKATYNYVYGDLTGTFTAASCTVDDIAGLKFDDFTVTGTTSWSQDLNAKVSAVDKNGVVIMAGTDIAQYLTYSQFEDTTKGYVSGNLLTFYKEGYSATITAKFSKYVYNTTSKKYEQVTFSKAATINSVKTDTDLNKSSLQFVAATATPDVTSTTIWSSSQVSLAAGDSGYQLYARYKNNNTNSWDPYMLGNSGANTGFTFTSNDTDKVVINGTYVYAKAAGTVTVIVRQNDTNKTVVGSFDVVVKDARSFVDPTVDTNYVTVGNNTNYGETKTVTATTVDSLGTAFAVDSATYNYTIKPSTTATAPLVNITVKSGSDLGKVAIDVIGKDATPGNYQLEVTLTGKGVTKKLYITVNVLNSSVAQSGNVTVASWIVELTSSSKDLKAVDAAATVTVNVNGYNSDGVKVDQLTTAQYTVSVKNAAGTEVSTNPTFTVVSASGTALKAELATGTYSVTACVTGSAIANRVNGSPIGSVVYTLSDTTTKTFAVDTQVVKASEAGTILAAVQKAFTFKLNGTDQNDATITNVNYSDGQNNNVSGTTAAVVAGHDYIINSIEITYVNANGNTVVYKFDVNQTIKVQ